MSLIIYLLSRIYDALMCFPNKALILGWLLHEF